MLSSDVCAYLCRRFRYRCTLVYRSNCVHQPYWNKEHFRHRYSVHAHTHHALKPQEECASVCVCTLSSNFFAHSALSIFLAAVSLWGHAIPSQRWKTGRRKEKETERKNKTRKGVGVRSTWAQCLGNNWHYCTKIISLSLCWRLSALLRCYQRVFCT